MVYLSHVRSDAESIRSSFYNPASLVDADCSITVDEPVGGPIVIRAEGVLDSTAVSVLTEFLDEALHSGRPLVLDVVDAIDIDVSILRALDDASSRLLDSRAPIIVACSEEFTTQLADADIDVRSHTTVARAVTASIAPRHSTAQHTPDATVRARPTVALEACTHALQGTYL